MIKVKAKIKINKEGRTTAFTTGYRPHCMFKEGDNTSGSIILLDREQLYPGEEAKVEIVFVHEEYLGPNFGVGSKFTFSEGSTLIGEGVVLGFELIEKNEG